MDLRIGGRRRGMPTPEKKLPFAGLGGMAETTLDQRRRSLNRVGRRGARRRTDREQDGWWLDRRR
jgi:hypothetical protein